MTGQVEDRVADELPGRVVRRLAAAVGLDQLHFRVLRHVGLALVCASAERDHRRVLEHHDGVGDRSLQHSLRERALELQGLEVRRDAEVQEVGALGHRTSLAVSLLDAMPFARLLGVEGLDASLAAEVRLRSSFRGTRAAAPRAGSCTAARSWPSPIAPAGFAPISTSPKARTRPRPSSRRRTSSAPSRRGTSRRPRACCTRGRTTIVVETDLRDGDGKHVARVTQTQAVL